jgi:hypothetical protein
MAHTVGERRERGKTNFFSQNDYRVLSSIMNTQVSSAHLNFNNYFWQKNCFCFSRIFSQELIIASLFIIKAIFNPFPPTFPCKVRREYFSIIFNVKKCALYSIKYRMQLNLFYTLGKFTISL